MKHNKRESSGLNRRELLVGLLGAAAVGFGSEQEARADVPTSEPDQEKQEESYEQVLAEIQGQIDAYHEQPTHLSRREIMQELGKCSFLKGTLPFSTIKTDQLKTKLQTLLKSSESESPLRDTLLYALDVNHVVLPKKRMAVVQVDFDELGIKAEAFYDTEYQAIFIDQQHEPRKAKKLSQQIYAGVMGSELNTRTNAIIDDMKGQPEEKIRAEIERVTTAFHEEYEMKERGDLYDIPPEILVKFANNTRAAVSRIRAEAAMQYIKNTTSLTHEGFHHFFETMVGEDGYEGPSQEEMLVLALQGIRDRDATAQAYKYAPEFFKRNLLEQTAVDISDDDSIKVFAKTMSERFDFTHYPTSAEDTLDNRDLIALYRLVNEFFARIYSGAQGSTDESYEAKATEQFANIPYIELDISEREKDVQYHSPNERELAFLRSMSWQGVPVIE